MKLLHVAESIQGGCGTYLNELVPLQISELGVANVRVLVPREHLAQLPDILPEVIVPFARPTRKSGLLHLWKQAGEALRTFEPDVIHAHSTFAGAVLRAKSVLRPRFPALIYCSHGWVFDVVQRRSARIMLEFAERLMAVKADKIIAISNYEYEQAKRIGISETRLVTIENGISPDIRAKETVKWADARLRVLFIGRLDRQKGVDVLIKAAGGLSETISVKIIGAAVNATDAAGEIPNNIELLGWRAQPYICGLLENCDVVAMPSRWEGFGLVAIEAMRSHKAVIASAVGGLTDVVVDGLTGVLVAPEDDQALRAALLSRSKEQWHAMGYAGHQRFLARYSSAGTHRKLMALYGEMAAKSSKTAVDVAFP